MLTFGVAAEISIYVPAIHVYDNSNGRTLPVDGKGKDGERGGGGVRRSTRCGDTKLQPVAFT